MNVPGLIKNANAQKFWLKPEGGEFTTHRGARRVHPGRLPGRHRGGRPALPGDRRGPAHLRLPDALPRLEGADPDPGRGGLPEGRRRHVAAAGSPAAPTSARVPSRPEGPHEDHDVHPGHPLRGPEEATRVAPGGVARLPQDGAQARRCADVRRPAPAHPPRRLRGLGRRPARPRTSTPRSTSCRRAWSRTTIHRHSWDAIMFIESGSGWTEIDGVRIDWKPWDTVHLPSWAWHRHGNLERGQARRVPHLERPADAGAVRRGAPGGGWRHARRGAAAAAAAGRRRSTARTRTRAAPSASRASGRAPSRPRLITRFEDVRGLVTKRGARSLFMVDKSIGYHTAGCRR